MVKERPPKAVQVKRSLLQCNQSFSFDESVVRAILSLVGRHPELVAERQAGGRLDRAIQRAARLRGVLDRGFQADGNSGLTEEVLRAFQRVFRKASQGLFFGMYQRRFAIAFFRWTSSNPNPLNFNSQPVPTVQNSEGYLIPNEAAEQKVAEARFPICQFVGCSQ